MENSEPIIIDAIDRNDINEVKRLLDEKICKVTDMDRFYNSLLHIAAGEYRNDVAKLLLEYGADVNEMGMFGRTPIFNAIDDSNFELIKLFVENGAELDITEHEKGRILLQCVSLPKRG